MDPGWVWIQYIGASEEGRVTALVLRGEGADLFDTTAKRRSRDTRRVGEAGLRHPLRRLDAGDIRWRTEMSPGSHGRTSAACSGLPSRQARIDKIDGIVFSPP